MQPSQQPAHISVSMNIFLNEGFLKFCIAKETFKVKKNSQISFY